MKKILTITGIAALAVTLFFNASLSREISMGDINLASLATVNHANAECQDITWQTDEVGICVNGYCFFTDYADPMQDCQYS